MQLLRRLVDLVGEVLGAGSDVLGLAQALARVLGLLPMERIELLDVRVGERHRIGVGVRERLHVLLTRGGVLAPHLLHARGEGLIRALQRRLGACQIDIARGFRRRHLGAERIGLGGVQHALPIAHGLCELLRCSISGRPVGPHGEALLGSGACQGGGGRRERRGRHTVQRVFHRVCRCAGARAAGGTQAQRGRRRALLEH